MEEAIKNFSKAINRKPDFVAAYNNLANVFKDINNLELAQVNYLKAIELSDDYMDSYLNLSSIRVFDKHDEVLGKMLAQYANQSLVSEDRCKLCFALGKVFEDLKDLGSAFAYFKEGNKLRKEILGYEIEKDKALFSKIKSFESGSIGIRQEGWELTSVPKPIFILGMTRSSTSLVEQIVSSHSKVSGAGELEDINRLSAKLYGIGLPLTEEDYMNFREAYLSALSRHAQGNQIVIDKMPQNFLYINFICNAFPDAKIIHVKRNAAATCWSNYKQLYVGEGHGHCYDLNDIADYYDLYLELMNFWSENYKDRIYQLNYEQLTEDQELQTRRLIRHLEIDWEEVCLKPHENVRSVRTASQLQVRKKVYKGSSQSWQKFKPYIGNAFDRFFT